MECRKYGFNFQKVPYYYTVQKCIDMIKICKFYKNVYFNIPDYNKFNFNPKKTKIYVTSHMFV